MKKIIIILATVALFGCNNSGEYPIEHRTNEGSVTYLNDSIVIIRTHKRGVATTKRRLLI